ncbi:cell division FtsZ family protein [Patescibacteria group bacterium]|nr:cell division FtsZ family protein [Patescibacteria group bacterium]MBU4162141.1 cell division FtsZ family protein [Patescibacteria group bacterium]
MSKSKIQNEKSKIRAKAKVVGVVPKKLKQETFFHPRIGIIGIGGGGGSIVGEIAKTIYRKKLPHLNKIKFIVANVDYQAIKMVPKQAGAFYFGKEITRGLGCGMNIELGEKSALQDKKSIEKLLKNCDFCIFISCLGGGTGSGATPVFAEIAKSLSILSLGIFTMPFAFEGNERGRIARASLEKIKQNINAFTIIPNQRIFKIIDEKTPIHKSLSVMNNALVEILEGFIETLYLPGLINLDFSDFRAVLEKEGQLTYLNSQEFSGASRAEKVAEAVLNNPLMNYDISGVERMLFNIVGSKDMKMSEVEEICKKIEAYNPQAKIIFGVMQDAQHQGKLKITLMAVGCGAKEKPKPKKKIIRKQKDEIKAGAINESEQKKEEEKMPSEASIAKPKEKLEEVKIPQAPDNKEEKPKIIKKKNKVKKLQIVKKTNIRRNALDLQKQAVDDEKKMLEEENKWEIPAFLRKVNNR